MLQLVCLGDRNHTRPNIQSALQGQTLRLLTPCQERLCATMSSTCCLLFGRKSSHMCLTWSMFLTWWWKTSFTGALAYRREAKRVCSHFRKSYLAGCLAEWNKVWTTAVCKWPVWHAHLLNLYYGHATVATHASVGHKCVPVWVWQLLIQDEYKMNTLLRSQQEW